MPAPRPQKPAIEQPGWIAPGIAFIRFNVFPDDAAVTQAAAQFMADHANAKAIIFDIRSHNGGGIEQMDVIFPWLFAKPTRLVAMATRASVDAEGGSPIDGISSMRPVVGDPAMVTREHWAMPNGDPRLTQAKVYVLTSGASASAAARSASPANSFCDTWHTSRRRPASRSGASARTMSGSRPNPLSLRASPA